LLLAAAIVLDLDQPQLASGRCTPLALLARRRALGYALFGLAAGFLAGTVNVMVPLLIIFTMELALSPQAMVPLFNLCFLAGKLTQIAAFAHLERFDGGLVAVSTPLVVAALAGLVLGMRLRQRIPAQTYRRLLRIVLWLFVALLTVQYLASV
jgi:hypothetical protein